MSTLGIIISILGGLLLLLLLIVLLAPFRLIVDSRQQVFRFNWQPIGMAQLQMTDDDFVIRFKLFFWGMERSLFKLISSSKKQAEKEKPKAKTKKKKSSKKGFRFIKTRIIPVWKSFKLEKLRLQLDTDDYCRNAYLAPVFHLLSNGKNRQLSVNFSGETELILIVQNRLIRILKAIIFKH
jgi:hypothetical protein